MASFLESHSPGITQRAGVAAAVRTATAMGAHEALAFISECPDEYVPPESIPIRCNDVVWLHLEGGGASWGLSLLQAADLALQPLFAGSGAATALRRCWPRPMSRASCDRAAA